jgi:hypothetical protein
MKSRDERNGRRELRENDHNQIVDAASVEIDGAVGRVIGFVMGRVAGCVLRCMPGCMPGCMPECTPDYTTGYTTRCIPDRMVHCMPRPSSAALDSAHGHARALQRH